MFGFLNPRTNDLRYRSAYARCCQHQHFHYGLLTLPFLSYEAAFLYQFALDARVVDEATLPQRRCCRLRIGERPTECDDFEIGRFTAALSILLTNVKANDDAIDGERWSARFRRLLVGRHFEAVRSYFQELDRAFVPCLESIVDSHRDIERGQTGVTVGAYAEPTASAFGYVFGLFGNVVGLGGFRDQLERLGRCIGGATVAADCATDWRSDEVRGNYNPATSERTAKRAVYFALDQLRQAYDICEATFGAEGRTSCVIATVHQRVLDRFAIKPESEPCIADLAGETAPAETVVLHAQCCVPCGPGAVMMDSNECGNYFAGCFCCGCLGCVCCARGGC